MNPSNMWINFYDIVQSWANKLTYRIVRMTGVGDESLTKYVEAVKNKNEAQIAADQELSATHGKFIVIKWLLFAAAAFALFKLYQRYKRKR